MIETLVGLNGGLGDRPSECQKFPLWLIKYDWMPGEFLFKYVGELIPNVSKTWNIVDCDLPWECAAKTEYWKWRSMLHVIFCPAQGQRLDMMSVKRREISSGRKGGTVWRRTGKTRGPWRQWVWLELSRGLAVRRILLATGGLSSRMKTWASGINCEYENSIAYDWIWGYIV